MTWHGWLSLFVDLFWIGVALALLIFGGYNIVDLVRQNRRLRQIRRELHEIDLEAIAKLRDLRAWGVNRWDGRR